MSNAMSYKGYTASMVFDTDGKIIVGRVLGIDDIIALRAESVESAPSIGRTKYSIMPLVSGWCRKKTMGGDGFPRRNHRIYSSPKSSIEQTRISEPGAATRRRG